MHIMRCTKQTDWLAGMCFAGMSGFASSYAYNEGQACSRHIRACLMQQAGLSVPPVIQVERAGMYWGIPCSIAGAEEHAKPMA